MLKLPLTRNMSRSILDAADEVIRVLAHNLNHTYPGSSVPALQSITMVLNRGEISGLAGLSASGKSTLGRVLKGLIESDKGEIVVEFDGERIRKLSAQERLTLFGWADAHPETQFFTGSVQEEIAFGLVNQGFAGDELEGMAESALSMVGLDSDRFGARHPRSLSGGEKRRAALASVAAMRFPFYIFDEPTAGLDQLGIEAVIGLFRNLKDQGAGVLWISHDLSVLRQAVNRLMLMDQGTILLDAETSAVDWDTLDAALKRGKVSPGDFKSQTSQP
jgi:energy-coupling factor transporter ATP-binding protein EcfA2